MKLTLGRTEYNVQWTLADRLAAWINPTAGAERLRSRVQMSIATGGYQGGKRDRRQTRNWRPKQTSANEELASDLPDLRSRSRDLARNVPIATGAINTVVTSVVGDGLVLQSQIDAAVLGLSPEQAEAWQRAAEREFAIWARRPDFTSRLNFDGLQELVLRAVLESGDILIVRRRRRDLGDTYGLKLQAVEADRLSNPGNRANTASIVDGVEMDSDGVPVAYHISTRHPDDMGQGVKREWKRYETGMTATGTPLILHLYRQLRPDQARGIPYLAPVIEAVKQLGDYAEAEIRAAVISAMFTVFIKQPELDQGDGAILGTTDGAANVDPKTEVQLGNGAIVDLGPGEDPVFADPKRPNTAFDGFVTAMSRHIGVALELPYELLLKSFTASYSASRAALEMAWQMFRTRRSWLAWQFCQPVYEWVITEAVASGRLAAPGFFADPIIREAWLGSDWIGPSRIQLDPLKEANADKVDLEMRTKTRSQIIMERTGGSFEAKHAQLVREQRMAAADGLLPAPAAPQSAARPAPVEDPVEDPADDTETASERA
jgi:lambda family phage portal protein